MYHEKQKAYLPEEFEDAQHLGEVLALYDEKLEESNRQHSRNFRAIEDFHQSSFRDEAQYPGRRDVDGVLRGTVRSVDDAAGRTQANVTKVMSEAADRAEALLSDQGYAQLHAVRESIGSFGLRSQQTANVMAKITDPTEHHAVRLILDKDILTRARHEIYNQGLNTPYPDQSMQYASSSKAYHAMRTVVDGDVIKIARSEASSLGLGSKGVTNSLAKASDRHVRGAFRASMDAVVYQNAKIERQHSGESYANRVLQHASSPDVRQVFKQKLAIAEQDPDNGGNGYNAKYENATRKVFRKMHQRQWDDMNNRNQAGANGHQESADEQRRAEAQRRAEEARAKAEAQAKAAAEAAAKRARHEEVRQIVSGVDSQYSWLKREDPDDVYKVINTVRQLREKWEAKGDPISDREIWLKFRRSIETGEQGGVDMADPKKVKQFKILDALMRGNLNNKIYI